MAVGPQNEERGSQVVRRGHILLYCQIPCSNERLYNKASVPGGSLLHGAFYKGWGEAKASVSTVFSRKASVSTVFSRTRCSALCKKEPVKRKRGRGRPPDWLPVLSLRHADVYAMQPFCRAISHSRGICRVLYCKAGRSGGVVLCKKAGCKRKRAAFPNDRWGSARLSARSRHCTHLSSAFLQRAHFNPRL